MRAEIKFAAKLCRVTRRALHTFRNSVLVSSGSVRAHGAVPSFPPTPKCPHRHALRACHLPPRFAWGRKDALRFPPPFAERMEGGGAPRSGMPVGAFQPQGHDMTTNDDPRELARIDAEKIILGLQLASAPGAATIIRDELGTDWQRFAPL